MKKAKLIFALLLVGAQLSFSQQDNSSKKDSLIINGRFGLMGRWQTGNLNQISIMPNGSVSLHKSTFYADFMTTYHFLRINGFNAIDDLWTYGLYQHQPNRRIFPSVHSIIGYSKSFLIDHSVVTGIGAGVNIHKKSLANYLQLHLFGSYFNFQYQTESAHKAVAISSLIRAVLPINKHVNFQWVFSTYHSTKDTAFWGGGNSFRLNITLLKNLMLNINHQTYYNHQTTAHIKNTNTEMLFGIQYNFSNH